MARSGPAPYFRGEDLVVLAVRDYDEHVAEACDLGIAIHAASEIIAEGGDGGGAYGRVVCGKAAWRCVEAISSSTKRPIMPTRRRWTVTARGSRRRRRRRRHEPPEDADPTLSQQGTTRAASEFRTMTLAIRRDPPGATPRCYLKCLAR